VIDLDLYNMLLIAFEGGFRSGYERSEVSTTQPSHDELINTYREWIVSLEPILLHIKSTRIKSEATTNG